MNAVLVNYNHTPDWLLRYDFTYRIYDRSDEPVDWTPFKNGVILKTKNIGNVDYDKLSYLVENYDTLPDVFLWGKSNLFKYIDEDEFQEALKEPCFKPLLTQRHSIYADQFGSVNYYKDGMYYERNNSWYLGEHRAKFKSWKEWAVEFGLPHDIPYIPFPPGGNFILTKEVVYKYSRDFYDRMRQTMPYHQTPGEAQLAERSYYLLWS